jgi:lipopolysaccharide export system permease protein
MKILDRYILKTFLVSLVIVLAAMMGLALLMDLLFNMQKFYDFGGTEQKAGFWTILSGVGGYYFYKSFDYFQMLMAPSILVAAAASFVRLGRARELTGIKAAGVSLYRVMWPMILVALVLDGFYIANQEIIIPSIADQLSRNPNDLEVRKEFAVEFVRDEHNNMLYAPVFDPKTCEMLPQVKQSENGTFTYLARVRIFLRDSKYLPRGTVEAERARWDPKAHGWRLVNGVRLPPMKKDNLLVDRVPEGPEGDPVDFYGTNIGPDEIRRHRASDFHRYMSYAELGALAQDPMRGNRRQLQVALHDHVTNPILNILLLLLGLPFVAGREDRNYFVGIGIAMGLVIGLFALTFAATAFGNAGHIWSPLLAAWLPVMIVLPASVLSMEALKT